MVIKRLALPGPSDQRLQTNHTVSDEEQGKAHGDCQRRTTRLLALPAPPLPLGGVGGAATSDGLGSRDCSALLRV